MAADPASPSSPADPPAPVPQGKRPGPPRGPQARAVATHPSSAAGAAPVIATASSPDPASPVQGTASSPASPSPTASTVSPASSSPVTRPGPAAPSAPPSPDALLELARETLRSLRRLGQAVGAAQGVPMDGPFPVERITLPVTLSLRSGAPKAAREAEASALLQDVQARVEEALAASAAYREGRVYCFWCSSASCAHATPGSRVETFSGYNAVGRPEWQSFINLCIERQEPRTDLIFAEPAEVIAIIQDARCLQEKLLPGFGRGSLVYNVLGQVVLGLIPLPVHGVGPADRRVALTFQVLEVRTGADGPRLRLNLLGLRPEELVQLAASAPPRAPVERVRRTFAITRDRVETLGRRVMQTEQRGQRLDLEAEVRPILARLKGDLERDFRPHPERTQHAEHRHQSQRRPTSNAMGDLRQAPLERMLYDMEHDTIIVLGPRSRAHVFSPEGRLVTSLQLQPGELERKTSRLQWQPLARPQAVAFQEKLSRLRWNEEERKD